MVDLKPIIEGPLFQAYKLLPSTLYSPNASVQVLATCGQESGFTDRVQRGGGPAHGWPQFELGKPGTGAGVYGVFEYPVAHDWLKEVNAPVHQFGRRLKGCILAKASHERLKFLL